MGCAALELARAGFEVFPLAPRAKRPITSNGFYDATLDHNVITDWWTKHPHANIAIRPPEGVIVLDVDPRNGGSTADLGPLTDTLMAKTGSGGLHLWFRHSGPSAGRVGGCKGIDIKKRGGYVVAPPSIHPSGDRYEWMPGPGTEIAELPAQLVERVKAPAKVRGSDVERPTGEPPGWQHPGKPMTELNRCATNRPDLWPLVLPGWEDCGSDATGDLFGRPGRTSPYSARAYFDRPGSIYLFTSADEYLDEGDYTFFDLYAWATGQPKELAASDINDFINGDENTTVGEFFADYPDVLEELTAKVRKLGTAEDTEDKFWTARPELDRIRQFARARMASKWALFGAVITHALATVPVEAHLPPTVYGKASVNFACAIVGRSGGGKSGTFALARELLPTSTETQGNLGTGEGIARAYGHTVKIPVKERVPGGLEYQPVRTAMNLVFEESEIGSFEKLIQRSGATLETTLRKAITGEELGFSNADPERRIKLMSTGGYRFGLLLGVQPELAGAIFEGTEGGTPQRLIWMPGTDPGVSAEVIECPEPFPMLTTEWIRTHRSWDGEKFLTIPDEVATAIRANHAANMRGERDALDGHALLTREKVAYGLALLARRVDGFTLDDWELAGMVMEVSNRTRKQVQRALAARAEDRIRSQGRAVAIREQAAATVKAAGYIPKVREKLAKYPEGISRRAFLRLFASKVRDAVEDALDELIAAGEVIEDDSRRADHRGSRVRLK